MNFSEKFRAAFRKIKTKLIVYLVLVIAILIMGVAPVTVSMEEARMAAEAGEDFSAVFITQIGTNIQKPLNCFGQCFATYFSAFLNSLKWYFVFVAFFALVGLLKAIPKHEFEDIENGSSDWSENGEQYAVLSRKKGIVLAEKNYLPVDKRGNINVLVVRRFWCW